MRWLKHLTLAHDDEVMAYLLEKFGAEGYGVWWLIQEKIGSVMERGSDKTCVKYSMKKWASYCSVEPEKFWQIVQFISQVHGKFRAELDGDFITIDSPNILKYRDEYSSRKPTPDSVPTNYRQTPDSVLPTRTRARSVENRTDGEQSTYRTDGKQNRRAQCPEWKI